MAEKRVVITIGRQYGSGGAETGKKLAEELGIGFYDKNILRMNSDESGIKESYFHLADEKAGNKLLYKIIASLTPEKGAPSFGSDLISADNLFRFQSEVIRKLAAEESCVIIGRCADYILRDRPDVLRVFIHADMEERIKRITEVYKINDSDPEKLLHQKDKRRAAYYQFYTDIKWGDTKNFHITLDSSAFGIEKCVEILKTLYLGEK